MPRFLDTSGKATLGIGICDRCKEKFPLGQLHPDRNNPGLRVCDKDNDEFDPWRLPPRNPDQITLPFYRPDEPLVVPGGEDYFYVLESGGGFYELETGDGLYVQESQPAAVPDSDPIATVTQDENGNYFWTI